MTFPTSPPPGHGYQFHPEGTCPECDKMRDMITSACRRPHLAQDVGGGAEFTRGFRLHLRTGQVIHGALFPSGHVVVVDDPTDGIMSGARSMDDLCRGGYDGGIEWADPGTCDASTTGLFGRPVGPCILRHQHDGPVHQDANGTTWSPIPGCTRADLVDQAARALLEVWLQRAEQHVIASAEEHCRELAGAAVDALLPAEPFREPRTEANRE